MTSTESWAETDLKALHEGLKSAFDLRATAGTYKYCGSCYHRFPISWYIREYL